MKVSRYHIIGLITIVSILVLGFALHYHKHFPTRAVAGEQSAGTWLSGMLLVIMASLLMVFSIRNHWYPWLLLAAFFLLLAIDEHFMLHEQLKEHIIFSGGTSRLIYESPAIVGACVGGLMAWMLWKNISQKSKLLFGIAITSGATSIVIDVVGGNVIWEECLKLAAELLVVWVLVLTIKEQ